ncbi:MAG: CHASE3 domain-containing protein, partial [Acidobacteriota bacterium]|nr:CHASE3 domain-containing protein [Acidobacteriota bacterium]
MKLALERQIQLAFLFALLLLLTLGFLGYRSANALGEALKWANHSQEVFTQLDDVIKLMLDAETGGLGFIITGREDFLELYNLSTPTINGRLSNLRRTISDNPQQTAELNKLENLITEKLEFTKTTNEIRRNQGLEAAIKRTESGVGKKIMDDIRLSVDRMKAEESRLLKLREGDLNNSISNTLFILFFGTFAGIVSLGLANFAIFREVGKRSQAEVDLKESNKDLEKRVEERTRELSRKNEELEEQIKHREQAEDRRRVALEAGSLGTWKLSLDGGDGEMDEQSLALFGLSREDFNGSSKIAFSRIVEEDAPVVDEMFRKSIVERTNFDAVFRIKAADGTIRWNNCTGQPQFDENGKITHFVGFCRDLTENKKNELALRDSESFARVILDSLPARIAVINKSGEIVAVNQAWQNYAQSNCLEEQIAATGIGQNYLKVCETSAAFEESTKEVVEKLRAVLDGISDGFSFEYPCHTPTEESWFILQVSPMKNGAVTSHIDISDRKRAETKLRNSEEFNRSIFENSPDCVHILKLDGTVDSINSHGLELMEIDDIKEYVGKQWVDFWEDEEKEAARQALDAASQGRTAELEGFRKTAKGTLRYWHASVAPIFDAGGKLYRLISTSRDITERREAESERERLLKNEQAARKDAEIANRLRDEFLATVSHELRAPLNSILGWGRILEKGKLDEKTAEKAINTIVRNAESQNRLIEDLLDVSRIISGKLRLEVITIKPINVVEAALETVRPAAQAKGITLEIKEDSDVSHISGDSNRLQQVV